MLIEFEEEMYVTDEEEPVRVCVRLTGDIETSIAVLLTSTSDTATCKLTEILVCIGKIMLFL